MANDERGIWANKLVARHCIHVYITWCILVVLYHKLFLPATLLPKLRTHVHRPIIISTHFFPRTVPSSSWVWSVHSISPCSRRTHCTCREETCPLHCWCHLAVSSQYRPGRELREQTLNFTHSCDKAGQTKFTVYHHKVFDFLGSHYFEFVAQSAIVIVLYLMKIGKSMCFVTINCGSAFMITELECDHTCNRHSCPWE